MLKRLRQVLEAGLLVLVYGICWALPVDRASALGGWIARSIGPRLPVSRIARSNLQRALPEVPVEPTIRAMWDNLGRTVAEYPHLGRIVRERTEVVGIEPLVALREAGRRVIFFSGHFANWELIPLVASHQGMPITGVYRAANNRWADRLLGFARRSNRGRLVPKGAAGARQMLAALRNGENIGLLVDQKLNDGIPVPLFGRPAMTAPALAQLAQRYGGVVVPSRVERLEGAHFRLVAEPALDIAGDVPSVMRRVNARLEEWIRARPEQWLWLHRRWPD